jgi:hypothetical protein
MRTLIITVSAANLSLGLFSLFGKLAESKNPALFGSIWASVIALSICGFLLTWLLAIVSVIVCSVNGGGRNVPLTVYIWLVISGVAVAWFLVGLFRFLFPRI